MSIVSTNQVRWDRQVTMAIVVAAIVLISRAILIAHSHGATRDENYHLYRGLILLRWDWTQIHLQDTRWNDPPFGEALLAIPAWLNGVHMGNPVDARDPARDVPPPPEVRYIMPDSIRIETAIWEAILFLPALAVTFQWVRGIYSLNSAWLILVMLLCEPTLAAHLPLPTVDVLGMSGIVIASWCGWRYIEAPSPLRRLFAAATMSMALALKNTALLMPSVLLLLAAIHWVIVPLTHRQLIPWRRYLRETVFFALTAAIALWIFTLGDFSVPDVDPHRFSSHILEFLDRIPIPAGLYVRAVATGIEHARMGHASILFGHQGTAGWWYYFPAVATFKIPVGIGVIFLIAIASLAWNKPRYSELPIFICAAVWTASLMRQHINIGFRHFLVPELFWLMLASRCVAIRRPVVTAIAWCATAAAAIHVALFTPDYLSYINFPRRQAYLQISDSNIDWGQATKELRHWIDARPDDGRPIYLGYFGPYEQNLFEQLGPRLTQYVMNQGLWISRTPGSAAQGDAGLPAHGILIVSPVQVTGQYDPGQRFVRFKNIPPKEIVGHCLLVYDLDDLNR